jgi:hypothetical protein
MPVSLAQSGGGPLHDPFRFLEGIWDFGFGNEITVRRTQLSVEMCIGEVTTCTAIGKVVYKGVKYPTLKITTSMSDGLSYHLRTSNYIFELEGCSRLSKELWSNRADATSPNYATQKNYNSKSCPFSYCVLVYVCPLLTFQSFFIM